MLDAEIEPHGRSSSDGSFPISGQPQRKARVPAFRHPSHGDRTDHRGGGEGAMPLHLDLADALEVDAAIAKAPPEVPRQTVIAADRAKARITGLSPRSNAAKKRGESPIESAKGVSHRGAAHIGRPHFCRANGRQLSKLLIERDRTVPTAPGIASLFQRCVVELAREAKLGFKAEPLADRGINPVPVGPPELSLISHSSVLHVPCDSQQSSYRVRQIRDWPQ